MRDIARPNPVPAEVADALASFSPHLQQLLYNRGVTTAATAKTFLEPSYDNHLHDPFLLPDIEVAVSRLRQAIDQQETIVIFSDYDCDGIPGAVVLHDCLQAIGHQNFVNVIPHRHYDGFGLSEANVAELVTQHAPQLIITIDCGTSNVAAVAAATAAGVDMIITDHHEPGESLPAALAVVNPKVGDTYPFPHLCGAAVVYKLCQALLQRGSYNVPVGTEKWWLDMVGIATVADMVPLVGENRVLAHYGLLVLRKSRRPGLQHLLRKQRTDQRTLTEDDIGFTIGPRINAASRMDAPEDAFNLLATTDEGEAGASVTHLEQLNTKRKTAVATMTRELHQRIKLTTELPPVLVFGNPEWRPSLVGLAANKLAEEHDRPVFLWGRDGNQACKGSCRSNGTVSVVRLMEAIAERFVEYGGHHFSGGFTVVDEYIHTFGAALVDAHEALGNAAIVPATHTVDAVITLDMIDRAFINTQQQCAPFGIDNPKPLYLFEQVVPQAVERFGKQQEHTKLRFTTNGLAREAIAFFTTPERFSVVPQAGVPSNTLAHVEESYFMNRPQVRLRIVDIV